MTKILTFFFIIFIILGNKYDSKKNEGNLVVNLTQEVNDSIYLDFSWINPCLNSLDKFPLYKKSVIESFKGVPLNDSISYYGNAEDGFQKSYDLYKIKLLDKNDFLNLLKKRNVDTLELSEKPIKQGFISIVGFLKNKQFIIADANRNSDFSDDVKYEFDINFRKNPLDSLNKIYKLPKTDYYYESYYQGDIQTYHRKLIFYPSLYERHLFLDKKESEYISRFRFRDYWKGKTIINNVLMEFYYQAQDNTFGALYIKPSNLPFSKTDEVYNNQYLHYTNDVITINKNTYKIDSIDRKITKLYLKLISKKTIVYGNRIGNKLNELKIDNVNGGVINSIDLFKKKKYTLIEFWGTWCSPCVAMSPKLIKINNNYSSKINILSIAHDKNIRSVRDFIKTRKHNWLNGFISNKTQSSVLKELNINQFPTFLLVDMDGEILYRGGADSLDDLLKLIK